jgi:MFS family permease
MLAAALALLVVGVTKGSEWSWTSPATIGSIGGGLLLLAATLSRARRHPAPALETSLWRSRIFAAANLTSLVLGAAVYAWLLICVLFVSTVWHYSALKAGFAVSPGAVTSAGTAVVCGRLVATRGARAIVVFGALLLAAVGAWCALAVGPDPNFLGFWLPAGSAAGVAMGAAMVGVSSAAATSVASTRFAAGTGLNMTARQLGGALGIATLAAILEAQGPVVSAFRDVFVFCSVAAVGAAIAAIRLSATAALRERDGGRSAVAPAHLA